jgi:hypothetical protein
MYLQTIVCFQKKKKKKFLLQSTENIFLYPYSNKKKYPFYTSGSSSVGKYKSSPCKPSRTRSAFNNANPSCPKGVT